jgi:capsular polysaccharide biosynthesis protein
MIGAGSGTTTDSPRQPIPVWVGKDAALGMLAERLGRPGGDAGHEATAAVLAAAGEAFGQLANARVALRDSAEIAGIATRLLFGKNMRTLAAPQHLSGMPSCFTPQSPVAHSPDFRLLTVPGGYCCHFPDCPVVVTGSGDTVVRDYSSRFAGLLHYYDADLRRTLAQAFQVNGTAIVLGDDVRPHNFCHWLIDWLPRLAALGELAWRDDTYVVVPPLDAAYQWETLRLCGFDAGRVIQLRSWQAVRARHLLVTSDLHAVPHPGHKAAAWLLNYLRGTLGYGAFLDGLHGPRRRSKLYVTRRSAIGRRVVNEDALLAALARAGYQVADTTGQSVGEQVALFATASHIVAPHGAGLANIVFAGRGATLVEIFPASYGTPAYYVLAAGLGMTYASYIATDIVPGSRSQIDDFAIDVADFMARCETLL